ncbi:cupin domain-containing protein [Burkholderia sp. Bp9140]|uniref:cupin domain-containing protein n=1 Tax=Burkholderia sp. Bp9140 TaxID=2184572 RepID=UPI000F578644|nr:cupin domain-containing protein [Burkholderia sp. Bp9140]
MKSENCFDSAEMKVAYSSIEKMKFNPGRRSWISYRDLGVETASHGAMRAEVMHIDDAKTSRPTGWHYHECNMQFLMVIEGWVEMEFPDLGVLRIKAGESMFIPGGIVHQELRSSEPFRLLEISLPAKMGTVSVEAPDGARVLASDYGEVEPARDV